MTARPEVRVDYLGFRESGQFAARDVAYAEGNEQLLSFALDPPRIDAFAATIARRQAHPVDRQTLLTVLREQYRSYGVKPPKSLALLAEEQTFTVVTAHQASLFLGPLYYIYKILSAVKLARQLNEAYPHIRVVPVFVLGAEDHDLEEIDHLFVNGERISWQTSQTGATGAMSLVDIEPALDAVAQQLGESLAAQSVMQQLRKAYRPDRQLAEATTAFVAELFAPYDVVVVNLNDRRFKLNFREVIRREVMQQESVGLVESTQATLAAAGFGAQAHAREINFFYLQPGRRDRIEQVLEGFRVLGTDSTFTQEEMLAEIEQHPERFSPNVVMRPLLQESALPNLAYVGGGGEIAYWLERKSQFAHFDVPFPILVRRDSAWWIEAVHARRLEQLGLSAQDLLGDVDALLRRYVTRQSETDVDFGAARDDIRVVLEEVSQRAAAVDPTLRQTPLALNAHVAKRLKDLETRLVRQLKKQQSRDVERIRQLRQALVPNGGLQERRDSFLPLYVRYGTGLFDVLLAAFDPLDMRLKVLVEPVSSKQAQSTTAKAAA